MPTDLQRRPAAGAPEPSPSSQPLSDNRIAARLLSAAVARGRNRFNGIIRDLRDDEVVQFRKHLQRLDHDSLRDRFNGNAGSDFLADYAARSFSNGTIVAGYFERGVLRGAGELHPCGRDSHHRPIGEIAFSVERGWHRCGIGTGLFRRLIRNARVHGIEMLHVSTHSENEAMKALARRFGADMAFSAGEAYGIIDINPVPDDLLFGGPVNRDADLDA